MYKKVLFLENGDYMEFNVEKQTELLEFLNSKITNKSKNAIKSLLLNELVLVNEKVQTKHNYILKKDDNVKILRKIKENIDIIYEDKDLIVVNKPNGLLTISTEKENNKTLYRYVSDYEKRINKNSKIFIVHRLDKDTSGIIIFAKNKEMKEKLQNNWNDLVYRKYIAVVFGKMPKKEDTIKSYIKENKNHVSFSSAKGDLAITHYKVLKQTKNYSLIDIEIKTGRKNQIRVHLSELGNPIVGDKKYGQKNKDFKFLMLHSYLLEINKKINGKNYIFRTSIPIEFNKLVNTNDIKNL